jgi:hypothetical protein
LDPKKIAGIAVFVFISLFKKFYRRAPILCGALDRIAVMQSASFALFVTSLQITWQRTRMFGR